jgi:DNA primase
MRIPENKIEEIRSSANIVDVISEVVQLRKRGKNFIGLCPFHSEKTPSFTVSEEKQIYHCFGCHTGGNVFKFLMEYEKISFVEAVQEMAERLGINIEIEEGDKERESEQEILYDINTEAAKYFSNNLLNSDEGEIGRKYFQNRKIKTQTLRTFGLGYAFNGWEYFVEFIKEKKLDFERCIQLGLIGRNPDGRLYDKFSSRIIFPIFSPNGRVVAFAGRILDEREGTAKYLNSPESLIYVKGRILYGLSFAKDEIRKLDKAILVEGYMDLISLHQSGIKNVVAVSGTALTEEQVQLLSRYTKNVVLLFDADTAGIKASMRSIEMLLKKDMEVKIVSLPAGEDPDSYVNNYGREKFEELISYAQNFLEYQTAYYESQGMFNDPAKTAEAIRELVKPVALINDELKRDLLIKSIAKQFNLREKLLETELEKILSKVSRQLSTDLRIREKEKENRTAPVPAKEDIKEKTPPGYYMEREIIKLLFEGDREIIKLVTQYIAPEEFILPIHKNVIKIVYESYNAGEDIIVGSLLDKISDESLEIYVREITFDKYSISKTWEEIYPHSDERTQLYRYAKDTIKNFKITRIDREILDNHTKLEEAEEEQERIRIMKINQSLQKDKESIIEELGVASDS